MNNNGTVDGEALAKVARAPTTHRLKLALARGQTRFSCLHEKESGNDSRMDPSDPPPKVPPKMLEEIHKGHKGRHGDRKTENEPTEAS